MPTKLIFLPLIAQLLLTLVLYVALAVAKAKSLKDGTVDLNRRALYEDAWPQSVQKINNSIKNQFQLPVLFYVVVMMLYELGQAHILVQAISWLFVASRVAHALIHTGSNYVPARRAVFTFGSVVLVVLIGIASWGIATS
jgi:hypothetical protein